ncbi:nucleotide exchange factor GrpE [Nostoc sp. FACHB-87]|uniref:nucleotide exchange factor GrpE n=1 Tax=Nostocaceae TaxID=1162 RepID=UPI00168858DD|nr:MULTISPECIES: nucleotide exchange factor GrpE [Nostocaceae]MBD2303455.1 nucleotide exchange factor GrpE [Nostoc sp. FACHB-190]MBD2456253.1 nucleotide exchange factor GrpE [Nostoc sp. FACHB-87]MBD2477674.1 nucleotide exchange factor GrpE [Anabaena sp. FACHB-83]
MANLDFTQKLQDLSQKVGITSFKALSKATGVSERQILRLRRGEVEQIRVDVLLKLASVLQVSLNELVTAFSSLELNQADQVATQQMLQEIADLKTEYQRSQLQIKQQRELLLQEFQQSSLQLLESLLLQFPAAAQKARENPQLEAVKILPLIENSLKKLLQAWEIEAIAPIGAEIPYDPQKHQLSKGNAQPGELVKVRYSGYLQGDKLLYRVTVSPIDSG